MKKYWGSRLSIGPSLFSPSIYNLDFQFDSYLDIFLFTEPDLLKIDPNQKAEMLAAKIPNWIQSLMQYKLPSFRAT